jgi:hypothetical protein
MTYGPPREWVAYEEASHAVVCNKQGVKIKLATIKPNREAVAMALLEQIRSSP